LSVPKLGFINLSYIINKDGFRINFQLDDSWRKLAVSLIESDFSSVHLKYKDLKNIGEYQLRPLNFKPTEQDRVAATLTFSRVVFNEDRTRACYYYEEYCGRLCGYGYLVFVERTKGTWKLVRKHQLWIS